MIAMFGFRCPRCWRKWTSTHRNEHCPFCAARNIEGREIPVDDRAAA